MISFVVTLSQRVIANVELLILRFNLVFLVAASFVHLCLTAI